MNKKVLLFLVLLCFAGNLAAQSGRLPGQILLQLIPDANPESVAADLSRSAGIAFRMGNPVAADWHMYCFTFDESAANTDLVLSAARRHAAVRNAQWNHLTDDRDRLIPNDSLWFRQVDMSAMRAPEAWVRTTGGLTANGDTIVLAIIEKGMRKAHPDLVPNLWHNWAEIPDNLIDDDNNGYVDDFTGWDCDNGNAIGDGDGTGSSHGTSVTGIVGARGNNTIGVTGVNWNVKLMTITNAISELEIIAAYNYIGKARKLYNTSGGKKGAFVVATNASFGINNERAEDHPLWCAVYDSLGLQGVLGIAATSNSDVNVDLVGDMPTTCPSDFLIAVTNMDASVDERVQAAGTGPVSIDLGAPGQGSFTTVNPPSSNFSTAYGAFGGTSAACPHVTGAVGLMYSANCPSFVADALTTPATCAERVRGVLLNTVTPKQSLAEVTTTGGRVNVESALAEIEELCSGVAGELEINDIRPNPVPRSADLNIRYQTPDYEEYSLRVYNAIGQLVLDYTIQPDVFLPKTHTVETKLLYPGVYILTFGRGKNYVTKKFVKL